MPRKKQQIISIVEYDALKARISYLTRIVDIQIIHRQHAVFVFEFLNKDQLGRKLELEFPLPARPQGPLAELLQACNQNITAGSKIKIQDIVGFTVQTIFSKTTAPIAFNDVKFHPVSKEGAANESTSTQ